MPNKVIISAWGDDRLFGLTDEHDRSHLINRDDKVKNKVLGMLLPTLRLVGLGNKYSSPRFECELNDLHVLIGLAYIDSSMLNGIEDIDTIKKVLLSMYISKEMERTDE